MDETYDCVILGTGLKECILSGILSVTGHKVLHMDRNGYYGGESASLNLDQLLEKFPKEGGIDEGYYGENRRLGDYNIDLIPKLIMADGLLVRILLFTEVYRYLELGQVEGSFVLHKNKIEKVPASDAEALKSNLLGFLEKRRVHKFFTFAVTWDPNDPSTHKGYDLSSMTMGQLMSEYSLSDTTVDFIGHAIALHRDDKYLQEPADQTIKRMQLYFTSVTRYGVSPYIYPLYGLGELPQAFARLSAVHGGTYMLNKPCDDVVIEGGKVTGVTSEGETAKCKFVVGDPTYFPDRVRPNGRVARCICFLKSSPVSNVGSAQIIVPAKQVGRSSDIYVSFLSNNHQVVPPGRFMAIVSALVETDDPEGELQPGLQVVGGQGNIVDKMFSVTELFEPLEDGSADGVYISKSYDQTTHFETTCMDILEMYERITGAPLDLSNALGKREEFQ